MQAPSTIDCRQVVSLIVDDIINWARSISLKQTLKQIRNIIPNQLDSMCSPQVKQMLPPVPDSIKTIWKKTLVLSLSGTLVDSTYKPGVGFEIKKRPNLDKFLEELSEIYEVIVFSERGTGFRY